MLYRNIMIDLETLSTSPDAVILTLGAITFNQEENLPETITDEFLNSNRVFYRKINIQSCLNLGLKIDKETENWWSKQDANVRFEALEDETNRITIKQALEEFTLWIEQNSINTSKVWANSPSFDCVILKEVYKKCGLRLPWKFWLERDVRTILDLANVNSYGYNNQNKHNAVYDCYYQICNVHKSYNKLRLQVLN
jgi:hypothetical protein